MESLTNDQVAERAQRWAILHKQEKNRAKMDAILDGLSADDQRRVYLCGQRMSGGLPLKVIPAENKNGKEKTNAEKTNRRGKRPDAADKSATGIEKQIPVGAAGVAPKVRKSKTDSVDPKQRRK
jgi:hypothetical protein